MTFEKFVGIPYSAHGRDYSGADCWGIVYLFYRDVLGVLIPTYADEMSGRDFKRHDIGNLVAAEREQKWERVVQPQYGDCTLMRTGHSESHVGVYIGDGKILHSEGEAGCLIERIQDKRIRNRIAGFFRLKRAD